MNRALALLVFSVFPVLAWEPISPMEIRINEGVTFALDFNASSPNPARAAGDPAVKCGEPKPPFDKGVAGQALCANEKDLSLEFRLKDNLTFAAPGSVSFWVKPVKWQTPDEMPFEKDGKSKVRLFQAFFLTCYNPQGGYLGIQRMSSHVNGGTDSICAFFAGLKGIHAGMGKEINLAPGQWHNLVMTWDPLIFRMYLDGAAVGHASVERKIRDDELSPSFAVCCPKGTLLDEVFVYDYVLAPETVKEFCDYRKGGLK